jgi:hypothetical protein
MVCVGGAPLLFDSGSPNAGESLLNLFLAVRFVVPTARWRANTGR